MHAVYEDHVNVVYPMLPTPAALCVIVGVMVGLVGAFITFIILLTTSIVRPPPATLCIVPAFSNYLPLTISKSRELASVLMQIQRMVDGAYSPTALKCKTGFA